MRLKRTPNASLAELGPRCFQRRPDRRGMMGVIVDERNTPPRADEFVASFYAAELFETVSNVAGGNADRVAQGGETRC